MKANVKHCTCNCPGIGHFEDCPAFKPWHKDYWKYLLPKEFELEINPNDWNEVMKVIEVTLDGVRYFVKVSKEGICLYLDTINSDSIYMEPPPGFINQYDKRKAKKFILRALSNDPQSK